MDLDATYWTIKALNIVLVLFSPFLCLYLNFPCCFSIMILEQPARFLDWESWYCWKIERPVGAILGGHATCNHSASSASAWQRAQWSMPAGHGRQRKRAIFLCHFKAEFENWQSNPVTLRLDFVDFSCRVDFIVWGSGLYIYNAIAESLFWGAIHEVGAHAFFRSVVLIYCSFA